MKVKLIIISIILLLVMVFASGCIPIMEKLGLVSPTNEEQLSPEKGGTPDGLVKVLIGFKEKPGAAQQAMVKGVGGKIKYTYNIIPAIAASVPEVAIEALKKNPNITNVELDNKVFALEQTLPWGIDRIDAEVVHDSGNKGAGIKVAIIDSGVDYTHEDLDANFDIALLGYDFVNSDDDPMDDDGHGTHVAGIIAAEDNGEGVVGVAPEAELYALKALDATGSGYVSDVILAIQWATDPDGDGSAGDRLDIINMSLGGRKNIFLEWACNLAYLDGLLLVAAAGNGGAVIYPAAYSSVIAVSATDEYDNLASFSSTGKQVELAAPGVDVNSTLPGNNYSDDLGETWSGTSMASPHVAGTAALVWAANLGWTNDDVRAQLQSTAEDIGLSTRKQGYGLVDAENAVLGTTDGDNLTPHDTGNISGTVTDSSSEGTPIEGAQVTANGYNATTLGDSSYIISDLSVGSYTVTASATGYTEESKIAEVLKDQTTTDIDFALTPKPTPSNTMHVNNINMSLKTAGPNVNAIATVTIYDAKNSPVEGANVSGSWSGLTNDSDSGITNTSGTVSLKSDKVKNPTSGTTFTFTVDDVTGDGWTYDEDNSVKTASKSVP